MDVFCICRWNFDDSDPEKDKGLFMACCSIWEKWLHQKCVKIKGNCFWTRKSTKDGNAIYVVQIEWYIFVWQLDKYEIN